MAAGLKEIGAEFATLLRMSAEMATRYYNANYNRIGAWS